jgi:hypothetical protein
VIVLVALASTAMSAFADELHGVVTSVDLTGKAIVVSPPGTNAEEKIKLGEQTVINMGGVKLGLSDLRALYRPPVTVRREAGVVTCVVVGPEPEAPLKNGVERRYLLSKTESRLRVYRDGGTPYFVPIQKGSSSRRPTT